MRLLTEYHKLKTKSCVRSLAATTKQRAYGLLMHDKRTAIALHSGSGSGSDNGSETEVPTETEFVAFCMSPRCGINKVEGIDLFLKCKGRGWKDGGGARIEDWRAYVTRMRKYIEQNRALVGSGQRFSAVPDDDYQRKLKDYEKKEVEREARTTAKSG